MLGSRSFVRDIIFGFSLCSLVYAMLRPTISAAGPLKGHQFAPEFDDDAEDLIDHFLNGRGRAEHFAISECGDTPLVEKDGFYDWLEQDSPDSAAGGCMPAPTAPLLIGLCSRPDSWGEGLLVQQETPV
jgi:hypothetical protein